MYDHRLHVFVPCVFEAHTSSTAGDARGYGRGRLWHRLVALAAAPCGDAASSATAARQRAPPHPRGSKGRVQRRPRGHQVTAAGWTPSHHATASLAGRSLWSYCALTRAAAAATAATSIATPRRPGGGARRPVSGAARAQSCADASDALPASRRATGLGTRASPKCSRKVDPARIRAETACGVAIPGPRDRRNRRRRRGNRAVGC